MRDIKYIKKFQNIGGTKGVIIPLAWIRILETKYPDRTLIGVHMDTDVEEIHITPLWEDE